MKDIQVLMEARGREVLVRAWQWPETREMLRARLSPSPAHPRAAMELLEALARWQGVPVHAAVVAGGQAGYWLGRAFPDLVEPEPTALVQVSFVDGRPARAGVVVRGPVPVRDEPELPFAVAGGRR